jgi:hypothetical protein
MLIFIDFTPTYGWMEQKMQQKPQMLQEEID